MSKQNRASGCFLRSCLGLALLCHGPFTMADHGGSTPHEDWNLSVPASSSTGNYTVSWMAGFPLELQEKKVGITGYSTIQQSGSSRTFSGKDNGTYSYRVRMRMFDKFTGTAIWHYSSPQQIVVDIPSVPGIPGQISGPSVITDTTGDGVDYDLTWSRASGEVATYQLQRKINSDIWRTIQNTSSRSRSETGRTAAAYRYRVRACNSDGCSVYTSVKIVSVNNPPPPGMPGAISAPSIVYSPGGGASYTVGWGAASGIVGEYDLQRRIVAPQQGWVSITPTTPLSRNEQNMDFAFYEYKVRACNDSGCSAFTSIKQVQVYFLPLPGAPGPISGPSTAVDTTGEGTGYSLTWTAASTGIVDTYKLQRRKNSGSWSTIQNTASRARPESGITAGSYEYRVSACNGSGCGPWTGNKPVAVTYVPPAPGVPGAIAGPSIIYDSTGTLKTYSLSWGEASGTVTRYELQRRTNGEGWSLPLDLTPDDATSTEETGVGAGTHEYHVRACNGPSCSAYTAVKSVEIASAITDDPDTGFPVSAVGTTPYALDASASGDALIGVQLNLIGGVAGFAPSLSLEYDSGRGVDRLQQSLPEDNIGYGWRLAGLSHVRRCVVNQPSGASIQLDGSDSLCLNGVPLVLASGTHFAVGAIYRTLIESYIRIEIKGSAGALWFEVTLPDGTVQEYGRTAGSRVDKNGGTDYQWSINKGTSVDGNIVTYTWHRDIGNGINYIVNINYANADIDFEYSPRGDTVPVSIGGLTQEQSVRLHTVRVSVSGTKVREYFLIDETINGLNRLNMIQQCGYDENGLTMYCLAPLRIDWLTPTSTIPGVPVLVNGMTDGLGATHAVEYGTITGSTHAFLFTERPFGEGVLPPDTQLLAGSGARRFVAIKLRQDNGLGGFHDTSFAYQGVGVESTRHWGFLGFFAQRIIDEPSGIVTYAQYRLDYPHFGRPSRISQFDAVYGSHTRTVSRSEWDYARQTIVHTNGISVYPYIERAISFIHEGATELGATQTEHTLTFTNGFVAQTVSTKMTGSGVSAGAPGTSWGDIPAYTLSGVVNTTEKAASFSNRTAGGSWLIGFPTAITRTSWPGLPSGIGIVQPVTMSPRANSLRPSTITLFPDDIELTLATNYGYDGSGRLTSTTVTGDYVPDGTTTVDFGSNVRYPFTITNAEGHATTFDQYDLRFGTVNLRGDPNGRSASWERDAFGRVEAHTNGDGVVTTTELFTCATGCPVVNGVVPAFRVQRDSLTTPIENTYFDKLGRVLRTERQSLDGSYSKRDIEYDALGRIKRVSLPYFSGTPKYITYSYDIRNRVTNVLRPDGSSTGRVYSVSGNHVIATVTEFVKKADGSADISQVKRNELNILGQLVKSSDAYGSGDVVSTTYTYDANGYLRTATVQEGTGGSVTTTYEYDDAGNRRKIIDSDIGTVTLHYTGLAQLRSRLDNKGQLTSFTYDRIGRIKTRIDLDGTDRWTWDTAANGMGKLGSLTGADGFTETYSYNGAGKLSTIVTGFIPIGGTNPVSYTTSHTYDTHGRPDTTTYPGGFVLTRFYNARGYLAELRDGSIPVQTFTATDPFGHPTEETYGNGVQTFRTYDPETGRLTDVDTSLGATVIQDNEYAWRSNGILESRTAHPAAGVSSTRQEVFTYDVLNRLKLAETWINGSNTRNLSYQYSTLGNLESKTGTLASDTDVTGYGYGAGAAGPHGVSSATVDGVAHGLIYDTNGAVTRYDIAGTSEDRWLAYNVANQPTRIVIGSSLTDTTPQVLEEFRYDPNGRRYLRESTWQEGGSTRTEAVHYVGDVEIIYYPVAEGVTRIYKTRLSPNVMHVKAEGLGTVNGHLTTVIESHFEYAHRDHLGSLEAVTDDSGAVLHNLAFEPFGSRKREDWSGNMTTAELDGLLATDWDRVPRFRGFTGHEHLDRAGFIHMNGRIYDPVLGRFLTPDPFVQFPAFSQNWNRYSYIDNKPTSFTDPSGFVQELDEAEQAETVSTVPERSQMCVVTEHGCAYGAYPDSLRYDWEVFTDMPSLPPPRNNGAGVGESDVDEADHHPILDQFFFMYRGGWEGAKNAFQCIWECGWPGSGPEASLAAFPVLPVAVESVVARGVTNIIGRSFGRLGTVVRNPGTTIRGFQGSVTPGHAVNQAINRGVSPQLIRNTVANPTVVLAQAGGRYLYLTEHAAVVITRQGQVVTTYGQQQFLPYVIEVLSVAGTR